MKRIQYLTCTPYIYQYKNIVTSTSEKWELLPPSGGRYNRLSSNIVTKWYLKLTVTTPYAVTHTKLVRFDKKEVDPHCNCRHTSSLSNYN